LKVQTQFKRSKPEKCGRIFVLELIAECHLPRKGITGDFSRAGCNAIEPIDLRFLERKYRAIEAFQYREVFRIPISYLSGGIRKLHSGGITGVFRCICIVSVALAELTAAQKCRFSGCLPASRLSFQRE
jgi:hypothetical protein